LAGVDGPVRGTDERELAAIREAFERYNRFHNAAVSLQVSS
jgi:hypothetical protein